MSSISALPNTPPQPGRARLDHKVDPRQSMIFFAIFAIGLAYAAYSVWHDVSASGEQSHGLLVYLLLAVALLIALGFEFVNGFHDTANAVATVIYTHSLTPNVAVVWSGFFNFLGVLTSTGVVAFGIVRCSRSN